jgi:hypothetical protein
VDKQYKGVEEQQEEESTRNVQQIRKRLCNKLSKGEGKINK